MTNLVEIDRDAKGVFQKHYELDLCYGLPHLCPIQPGFQKGVKQYGFHAINMDLGSYNVRYSLFADSGDKLVCVEFPVTVVQGN